MRETEFRGWPGIESLVDSEMKKGGKRGIIKKRSAFNGKLKEGGAVTQRGGGGRNGAKEMIKNME